MNTMVRVKHVEALEGYTVRLTFTDGSRRTVDLTPYLRGPVFEPLLRDREAFRQVRVDPELGTIVWPNGADIDPDVLYHGRTPVAFEDTAP
jgi:hypothetical protein